MVGYFYPRPPRGGRHLEALRVILGVEISIHALREEGDTWAFFAVAVAVFISIHALREEGDAAAAARIAGVILFLSTPSARRATKNKDSFISIKPISIHALREEGDRRTTHAEYGMDDFYPRPPRGGRPRRRKHSDRRTRFLSTPSARRATDEQTYVYQVLYDFYPRPPRGGRQQKQRQNLYFQTNYTTFCTNLEEP